MSPFKKKSTSSSTELQPVNQYLQHDHVYDGVVDNIERKIPSKFFLLSLKSTLPGPPALRNINDFIASVLISTGFSVGYPIGSTAVLLALE